MDLTSMLPMLMNLLQDHPNQTYSQQNITPQDVLNSYPNTYISNSHTTQDNNQQPQNQRTSSPLDLSMLSSLLGGGQQNSPLNMLSQLLPSLKQEQKNNSLKISELKSIDEYTFD